MIKILGFFVRQLTRLQYGLGKFSIFFNAANFISLLLLVVTANVDLDLKSWHLVLIYIGMLIFGIIFVVIIEKLGGWEVDVRQQFKMTTKNLYKDQVSYHSLLIASALKMTKEEIDKEIQTIEERLFQQ